MADGAQHTNAGPDSNQSLHRGGRQLMKNEPPSLQLRSQCPEQSSAVTTETSTTTLASPPNRSDQLARQPNTWALLVIAVLSDLFSNTLFEIIVRCCWP